MLSNFPVQRSIMPNSRAQGFVDHIDDIRCPQCASAFERGRLLDTGEWGYLRCEKRPAAGAEPCGCKILVMFFVRRGESRDGAVKRAERPIRAYVAEVDWREVEYFEQEHYDVDRILKHLQRYEVGERAARPLP
jgi:hypothetical protein